MKIINESYHWQHPLTDRTETGYITLHHAAAVHCTAQDVHQWHLDRGWSGIGYHFFVAKDGTVVRGRPLHTAGSHCLGYNGRSVGICAEGSFEVENMPQRQMEAIIALSRELLLTFLGARILGHRELTPTLCPGKNFPLDEIREEAGKNQGALFPDLVGHFARPYVEAVAEAIPLAGWEDRLFHPDQPATRGEMMVLAYRILKAVQEAGLPLKISRCKE